MGAWKIVPAAPEHIASIAENMREADRREVWAGARHTPDEALRESLRHSELAWTCLVEGVPAFMWGVGRIGSLISVKGAPWLLGTDDVLKIHREFLRQSRAYVEQMHRRFPELENYVHAENKLSIRWLKWCGFTLDIVEPVNINNEVFFRFWRIRHV